jgi:hypothetical protein
MNKGGRSPRGHLFNFFVIDIEEMTETTRYKKMDVFSGYLFNDSRSA